MTALANARVTVTSLCKVWMAKVQGMSASERCGEGPAAARSRYPGAAG